MRKKFAKSVLCASLAVALIVGEAGTALAAEPADVISVVEESADVQEPAEEEAVVVEDTSTEEVTTEETVTEEVTTEEVTTEEVTTEEQEVTEETTESQDLNSEDQDAQTATTPSVSSLDVYTSGSSLNVSFYGYAYKYVVTINGVQYSTFYNPYYDEYSDNAPYYYESFSFYSTVKGGKYKITVTPYGYDGTAGTKKSVEKTIDMPVVSSSNCNVYGTTRYNEDGKTTGYRRPYVEAYFYLNNCNGDTFQIQRRVGTGSWKTVSTITTYGSVLYTDYNVVPGKTYSYRIRYKGTADGTYLKSTVFGKWSSSVSAKVGTLKGYCSVSYGSSGITISADTYNSYASGYEVYRSTSKNGTYKKIATITDTYYIDKSVKSGTYYYKIRPYYYDVDSKKKYQGEYSDPKGVKIVMESVYAYASQTDTNQATISWSSVPGANYYEVYYKTDLSGDAYTILTSTQGTSFKAGKLMSDTTYYFQVRAYKKVDGVKTYYQSDSVNLYMGFSSPKNVYVSKKTISATSSKMTIKSVIKWDRVFGAKKIRVEGYNPSKSKYETIATLSAKSTSYTLNNTVTVTNGNAVRKYTDIRIVAVNGTQEAYSSLSDSCCSLNSVTNVKVSKKSASSALIKWTKTKGANSYTVYRIAPNGNTTWVGSTSDASLIDDCLTPGVNYSYYVTPYNTKFGVSGSSSYSAFYKHKLSKPMISKITNTTSKQAKITWKKMPYAQKYVIYRSESKNGTFKKLATVYGGSKTSYTDTKVTKGKTYYYKVQYLTNNDAGITMTSELSNAKAIKITK